MTDTETRRFGETTWVDTLPPEIKRLECALTTAFHALDDIDRMTMPHRIRVVDDITGTVPDAAAAAARAGHADWALTVVRTAAERRPAWATLCGRWDTMIATSIDAIASVDAFA